MTSIDLALSLSREGNQNVFLIDLDMRRPTISRYLGVYPKRGVQDAPTAITDAASIFFRIGAPGLVIAAVTESRDNSSELLSSERLRAAAHRLRLRRRPESRAAARHAAAAGSGTKRSGRDAAGGFDPAGRDGRQNETCRSCRGNRARAAVRPCGCRARRLSRVRRAVLLSTPVSPASMRA